MTPQLSTIINSAFKTRERALLFLDRKQHDMKMRMRVRISMRISVAWPGGNNGYGGPEAAH